MKDRPSTTKADVKVFASPDHLADDLMARIAAAIDEWRAANELLALPREIVFEQAVSIINVAYGSYLDSRGAL